MPKMKYKVPISLWFVDVNQRREEENIPKEGKREERKIEGSALSQYRDSLLSVKSTN